MDCEVGWVGYEVVGDQVECGLGDVGFYVG